MRAARPRGAATAVAALVAALAGPACMRPVVPARRSIVEPPAPAETDAEARLQQAACSPRWGLLFPGLAQLCLRQTGEGVALAGAGAAEIGTAVAAGVASGTADHPGVQLPLTAVQDLYVYGVAAAAIEGDLARRARFAPHDSAADLLAAPFNLEVLRRPAVWLGIAGTLAVGLTVSIALSDIDRHRIGADPDLFGHTFPAGAGYPLGVAAGAALFSQVAMAEETLFRGYVQSALARSSGETRGWLGATLVFGAAHIPNAFLLPPEDRTDYLIYGLPIITAAGAYLGWLYRRSGYALAPSTAVHFWYDLALTSTLFVLDPDGSPFAASISFPF